MADTERRILFNLGANRRWRFTVDRLGDYMHRWYVFTPWFGLRLHKILRGDGDRHFHDHPFGFASLILSGSYVEHLPARSPRTFLPGNVNMHKAESAHRLELPDGHVWTFVLTGPYEREWGFHTEDGWIHNRKYSTWLQKNEEKRP